MNPPKISGLCPADGFAKMNASKMHFERISLSELGIPLKIADAHSMGVFEHLYERNFAEQDGISTHYIVLAYAIKLDLPLDMMPKDQHQLCRWWPVEELKDAAEVHPNTKAYFLTDIS